MFIDQNKTGRDVCLALAAYAVLFGLSFILSINLGLGKAESIHDPSSSLFYLRRGLMVIAALAIPWFTKRQSLSAFGWKPSVKWVFISVSVGMLIGLSNRGGFNPKEPVAIVLALFHTFSTELFFRGYIFRTLDSWLKGPWTPLFFSSLLYGFSYLTVYPIWHQPLAEKTAFVLLFTVLGILFASSYRRSGSFFIPWMMHFFGVLKYGLFF